VHELRSDDRLQLNLNGISESGAGPSAGSQPEIDQIPGKPERRSVAVIVRTEDFPYEATQDSPPTPLGGTLDGHCWYPAVQRCGCGLSLRSALLWTDHIAQLSAPEAANAS
jgi:hypothetical protein